jgi:hypothetical protein
MNDRNPPGGPMPSGPTPALYWLNPPPRVRCRSWRERWRGVRAVAALLLSAADALLSAVVGRPPAAWYGRQVALPIITAYRSGSSVPAEVDDLDDWTAWRQPGPGHPADPGAVPEAGDLAEDDWPYVQGGAPWRR